MPPASTKAILAGAVAAALVGAEARAQAPIDLPAPIEDSAPIAPRTAIATAPAPSCAPGHCTHRAPIARWRCKRHLQEAFLGFPEEFERPPLGARMHAANAAQVGNSEAAAMVLHRYDFEPGGPRLNLLGLDKLRAIAAGLPATFHPVVVERTPDDALDQARRGAVLAGLEAGPFPIDPGRVVVALPRASGLSGQDALYIDLTNQFRTIKAGPVVDPLTGGGTTGAGTSNVQ